MGKEPERNDLDQTLENSGWLKALAVHLVGPDRADDLVQDAWVKALERPPRKAASLRQWMARVLTTLSLNSKRTEGRRRRREQWVTGSQASVAPDETAAVLEVHEQVVQAVRVLREPYRTAIFLRFYEGLSTGQIANRLSVPPSTARNRLARGLVELRKCLEARHGTDWRDASLAILLPTATSFLPPAATAAGLETLALTLKTKMIAAAGVLALTTGFFLWPDGTKDELVGAEGGNQASAEMTTQASEGTGHSVASPIDAGSGVLMERTERTLEPEDSWVVSGQVVRENKIPAPRIEVQITLHDGFDRNAPVLIQETVVSDSEGRFSWKHPQPQKCVYLVARPVANDHYEGSGAYARVLAEDAPPQDLEIRIWDWDLPVHGFVRDQDNRPIPGASVLVTRREFIADQEGRYEFLAASSRKHILVSVRAEGFGQVENSISTKGAAEVRADFILGPEFRVSGRTVDTRGNPVAGVKVESFGVPKNAALSDINGRFTLGHLPPDKGSLAVYARHEGYVEASRWVDPAEGMLESLELVMERGTRVEGSIVGDNEKPLVGAELYIGEGPSYYNRIDAIADETGHFLFPRVAAGTQKLHAEFDGYAPVVMKLDLTTEMDALDGLEIVLGRGHFLEGVIVDSKGEAVPGVYVSPRWERQYAGQRSQSDAKGHFRLEGLPTSQVQLEFYGSKIVRLKHDLQPTDFDRSDHRFVVEPGGGIAGRVVDGKTGKGLNQFSIDFFFPKRDEMQTGDTRVSSLPGFGNGIGLAFSGTDGLWSVLDQQMPIGKVFGVRAIAPGYRDALIDRVLVAADPVADDFVIRMFPGKTLQGWVVSADDGLPIENARVWCLQESQLGSSFSPTFDDAPSALSDASGQFKIQDLGPGEVWLQVEHPDWAWKTHGPVELTDAGPIDTPTVRLVGGAAAHGTARAANGSPLVKASIELQGNHVNGMSGGFRRRTLTDSMGHFTFDHLPGGQFTLSLEEGTGMDRLSVQQVQFHLREGEDMKVGLGYQGSGSLSGTVSWEGLPPERMIVQVYPPGSPGLYQWKDLEPGDFKTRSYSIAARNGRFRIPALEPGQYRVSCTIYDQASDTRPYAQEVVEIEKGTESAVVLRLK